MSEQDISLQSDLVAQAVNAAVDLDDIQIIECANEPQTYEVMTIESGPEDDDHLRGPDETEYRTEQSRMEADDPFMVSIDNQNSDGLYAAQNEINYRGKIAIPEFTFLDGSHLTFVGHFPGAIPDDFSVQSLAERVVNRTHEEIMNGRSSGTFHLSLSGAANEHAPHQCEGGVAVEDNEGIISFMSDAVITLDDSMIVTSRPEYIDYVAANADPDGDEATKATKKRKRRAALVAKHRVADLEDDDADADDEDYVDGEERKRKKKSKDKKKKVSTPRRASAGSKAISVGGGGDGRRNCTRCHNHAKISTPVRDHICPFKSCSCDSCLLIMRRSLVYRASMNAMKGKTKPRKDLNAKAIAFQDVTERISGLQPIHIQAMLERYDFRVESVIRFVRVNIEALEVDPEGVLEWLMRDILSNSPRHNNQAAAASQKVSYAVEVDGGAITKKETAEAVDQLDQMDIE